MAAKVDDAADSFDGVLAGERGFDVGRWVQLDSHWAERVERVATGQSGMFHCLA
jgi:hypothetical protein